MNTAPCRETNTSNRGHPNQQVKALIRQRRQIQKKQQNNITQQHLTSIHSHIVNLSSRSLSQIELGLLSKGLNFIPNPKVAPDLKEGLPQLVRDYRLRYFFKDQSDTVHKRPPLKAKSCWTRPMADLNRGIPPSTTSKARCNTIHLETKPQQKGMAHPLSPQQRQVYHYQQGRQRLLPRSPRHNRVYQDGRDAPLRQSHLQQARRRPNTGANQSYQLLHHHTPQERPHQ